MFRMCNACFNAYGFYSGLIYDSMLVLIIGSMIGFVLFNLGVFGRKEVFFWEIVALILLDFG